MPSHLGHNTKNHLFGFTIQKTICDKFNILPESEYLIHQFNSLSDEYKEISEGVCNLIFVSIGLIPVKCTTLSKNNKCSNIPYNFILSDNSTLSIRTNISGDKISPRIVGQAGYSVLNEYFSSIYGSPIKNQKDIKKLIITKIDEVLPIFFEKLFDADYIALVSYDGEKTTLNVLKGDLSVNIDFDKSKFSFTRGLDKWSESSTIKYEGKSIAEVQVHKNRTFKFRFIMKNVIPLLIEKAVTTETLGITAEKAICDKFGLSAPASFLKRYSSKLQSELTPAIDSAFTILPKAIKHSGSDTGTRGGASKCSYDFLLEDNQTLSVKTNIGKMVCPPEVGQPGASTCYLYFNQFTNADHIDELIYKQMVYNHINEMLPIFLEHMFDSNYLLWLYKEKEKFKYKIIYKNYAKSFVWDFSKISFTKPAIDEWNESNTLKYDEISIGEFQIHKKRDCFKFRFNFPNLIKVIEGSK
ncbi:MAG: hypothetical protein ACI4U5_03335 [Bacilli bacterium]